MIEAKLREIEDTIVGYGLTETRRGVVKTMLDEIRAMTAEKVGTNGGPVHKVGGKRVFIGMPHLGAVEADAVMRAVGDAVYRDTGATSTFIHQPSSLLCQCFNRLWTDCLNEYEVDYWLLNHADLWSKDKYAARLIDELEGGGFDVVHAVAAIKDNFGLTSTAAMTTDPWDTPRRLTMFELDLCPKHAFGIDEMMEAMGKEDLLAHSPGPWLMAPNTGMMLVKIRGNDGKLFPWTQRFPGFHILDRVVRQEFELDSKGKFIDGSDRIVALEEPMKDGQPYHLRAQVLSEDWNFGLWCHHNGLKVGATRAVETFHAGSFIWTNQTVWGVWCNDEDWLERDRRRKIGVELANQEEPWFPYHVRGWLSVKEGDALRRWADGKRVLEIGSYCGKSTICLAQHAVAVHAVDTFDGRGTPAPCETLSEFLENIAKHGVSSVVHDHIGEAKNVLPNWACAQPDCQGVPKFDLAFIDGAHDLESVKQDVELVLMVLEPGGCIAFHDYKRKKDPDVAKCVDELLASGWELVELIDDIETDSHAVLVRPPHQP